MSSVKLVNHSSVLVQDKNEFILSDPWFEKPAFGSWLPVPPTSVHPAYLVCLAKSSAKFNILISHGHDDHMDDDFISLFPKDTTIIIPEYKSRGLRSRVERLGFNNIVEAPTSGVEVGSFEIKSYINMSISRDDAVVTIASPNSFVIHANDNWQELAGDNLQAIKSDASSYDPEQILYMSQCNLADGFPNIYEDYTMSEKMEIHTNRVDNIISGSLLNASNVGARYFLNYAGYAAAFLKGDDHLRDLCSFKTNSYIEKARTAEGYDLQIVDMIPGDSFNFDSVSELFPGVKLDPASLKDSSYEFYERYDRVSGCDTYKNYEVLPQKNLQERLQDFLNSFSDFVVPRLAPTNFNTDILGFRVAFECSDTGISAEVVVGGEDRFDGREAVFISHPSLLSEIMRGAINWENLYIGYGATVRVEPKDVNIRSVVRWMAMYGYVHQRNMR
tara:strand:+ start:998 stop:2332 length:1335 start_codon:yes stop_codon:yes gene_type:complete